MGLDQYAYIAAKSGQQAAFYEGAKYDDEANEYVNPHITQPREIAYWRKHPNLHGWMEDLAERKGLDYKAFNGIELELTWQDLDELEQAVKNKTLPRTQGFFFGDPKDDYYQQQDLEFIKAARAELFMGLKVFYNSSW